MSCSFFRLHPQDDLDVLQPFRILFDLYYWVAFKSLRFNNLRALKLNWLTMLQEYCFHKSPLYEYKHYFCMDICEILAHTKHKSIRSPRHYISTQTRKRFVWYFSQTMHALRTLSFHRELFHSLHSSRFEQCCRNTSNVVLHS